MNQLKNLNLFLVIFFISSVGYAQTYISVNVNQPATLQADAGLGTTMCVGNSVLIGGSPSATNGTAPYTYSWSPVIGLSDASIANPTASPAATTPYSLIVTDFNGCTHNDFVTVTVDPCAGIAENTSSLYMNIFPNPNNGIFTVALEGQKGTEQFNIQVMSTSGQIVYTEMVITINMKYEKQINISDCANGIYFVKVQGNGNYITKKIFVK